MSDAEYNAKIESVQRFIPFLENMIQQLKDPTRKNREQQLNKMESLYSMITDTKKKLKIETLVKCEEVIVKLHQKVRGDTAPLPDNGGSCSPGDDNTLPPVPLPRRPSVDCAVPPVYRVPSEIVYNGPRIKESVFNRLGTRPYLQKPPISYRDLEVLQADVAVELEKKMSLNELNSLRTHICKELKNTEINVDYTSGLAKPQTDHSESINTIVKNNCPSTRLNVSPDRHRSKTIFRGSSEENASAKNHIPRTQVNFSTVENTKETEIPPDKNESPNTENTAVADSFAPTNSMNSSKIKATEADGNVTPSLFYNPSSELAKDATMKITSPIKVHQPIQFTLKKNEKVLKEPCSVFGSILSGIDDESIGETKKKTERLCFNSSEDKPDAGKKAEEFKTVVDDTLKHSKVNIEYPDRGKKGETKDIVVPTPNEGHSQNIPDIEKMLGALHGDTTVRTIELQPTINTDEDATSKGVKVPDINTHTSTVATTDFNKDKSSMRDPREIDRRQTKYSTDPRIRDPRRNQPDSKERSQRDSKERAQRDSKERPRSKGDESREKRTDSSGSSNIKRCDKDAKDPRSALTNTDEKHSRSDDKRKESQNKSGHADIVNRLAYKYNPRPKQKTDFVELVDVDKDVTESIEKSMKMSNMKIPFLDEPKPIPSPIAPPDSMLNPIVDISPSKIPLPPAINTLLLNPNTTELINDVVSQLKKNEAEQNFELYQNRSMFNKQPDFHPGGGNFIRPTMQNLTPNAGGSFRPPLLKNPHLTNHYRQEDELITYPKRAFVPFQNVDESNFTQDNFEDMPKLDFQPPPDIYANSYDNQLKPPNLAPFDALSDSNDMIKPDAKYQPNQRLGLNYIQPPNVFDNKTNYPGNFNNFAADNGNFRNPQFQQQQQQQRGYDNFRMNNASTFQNMPVVDQNYPNKMQDAFFRFNQNQNDMYANQDGFHNFNARVNRDPRNPFNRDLPLPRDMPLRDPRLARDPRTYKDYKEQKERETREREAREREIREREAREQEIIKEREVREKEIRERDAREKEIREVREKEREAREKEREAREKERIAREKERELRDKERERERRDSRREPRDRGRDGRGYEPRIPSNSRDRKRGNYTESRFDKAYCKRDSEHAKGDDKDFVSPLDSLYLASKERTGKGYGLQYKIPKKPKEPETVIKTEEKTAVSKEDNNVKADVKLEPERTEKIPKRDAETVAKPDKSKSKSCESKRVEVKDEAASKTNLNKAKEEIIATKETKVNDDKTKEAIVEKQPKPEIVVAPVVTPPKLEKEESKPEPHVVKTEEPKLGSELNVLSTFFTNLMNHNNKGDTKGAILSLISTFSDSFSEQQLEKITRIIQSDQHVDEETDSSKKDQTEVKESETEHVVKAVEESSEANKIEIAENVDLAPVPSSSEKTQAEDEEDDDVVVSVGERIKNRRRNVIVDSPPVSKCRKTRHKTELDMLHEDIKDMFIRDGVVTATGKRMCRILKDNPIAELPTEDAAPKSSLEPKEPLSKKRGRPKIGPNKPKIKPPMDLQAMGNVRVVLRKVPLDALKAESENRRYGLRRTLRNTSYAEDQDVGEDVAKPAEPETTETEDIEVDVEAEEGTKVQEEEAAPKKEKKVVRKKRGIWATGIIKKKRISKSPNRKEKEYQQEEETQIEDPDITPADVTSDNANDAIYTPDKLYYTDETITKLRCKVCESTVKFIAAHYRLIHPEIEVLSSRLSPDAATLAIEDAIENEDEYLKDEIALPAKSKFKCRICNFVTYCTTKLFYDHVSTHTGEFRHKCPKCDYSRATDKAINRHIAEKHEPCSEGVDKHPVHSDLAKNNKILYGYICSECNYIQMNEKSVVEHVKIYHLGEGKKIHKITMDSQRREFETASSYMSSNIESDATSIAETITSTISSQTESSVNKESGGAKTKSKNAFSPPAPKPKTKLRKRRRQIDVPPVSETDTETETESNSDKSIQVQSSLKIIIDTQVTVTETKPNVEEEKKKIDMNVFTCDTDLQHENDQIQEERYKKMQELSDTIKTRHSLDFVEKLSNRLKSDEATIVTSVKQEPPDEYTHSLQVYDKNKATAPSSEETVASKQETNPKKESSKDNTMICGVIEKLQGKLSTAIEQEQTIEREDTPSPPAPIEDPLEGPPPLKHVGSLLRRDSKDCVVLNVGPLKIVKSDECLIYVCTMPPCIFSSRDQQAFSNHCQFGHDWDANADRFKRCAACDVSMEYDVNTPLLTSFLLHVWRCHSEFVGVKIGSIRVSTNLFPSEASDDVPPEESVPEATETTELKLNDTETETEQETAQDTGIVEENDDENPFSFKIVDVMSLADEVDPPPLSPINNRSNAEDTDVVNEIQLVEIPSPSADQQQQQQVAETRSLEIPLPSLVCTKKTEGALKKFLTAQHDLYKCPEYSCYFTTNKRVMFDIHVRMHPSLDETHNCIYCEEIFCLKELADHYEAKHSVCRFACGYCMYRCIAKDYVDIHQLLVHPEHTYKMVNLQRKEVDDIKIINKVNQIPKATFKPYTCCDKEFYFLDDFNQHYVHVEHQDPMSCPHRDGENVCSFMCAVKDLHLHWSHEHGVHHLQCSYCEYGHEDITAMMVHLVDKHPTLPPDILDRNVMPKNFNHHTDYSLINRAQCNFLKLAETFRGRRDSGQPMLEPSSKSIQGQKNAPCDKKSTTMQKTYENFAYTQRKSPTNSRNRKQKVGGGSSSIVAKPTYQIVQKGIQIVQSGGATSKPVRQIVQVVSSAGPNAQTKKTAGGKLFHIQNTDVGPVCIAGENAPALVKAYILQNNVPSTTIAADATTKSNTSSPTETTYTILQQVPKPKTTTTTTTLVPLSQTTNSGDKKLFRILPKLSPLSKLNNANRHQGGAGAANDAVVGDKSTSSGEEQVDPDMPLLIVRQEKGGTQQVNSGGRIITVLNLPKSDEPLISIQDTDKSKEPEVDPLCLDAEIVTKTVSLTPVPEYDSDSKDADLHDVTMKKTGLAAYDLYRCAVCDLTFANSDKFKGHLTNSVRCKSAAGTHKPYKCVHCTRFLKNPQSLIEHMAYHGQMRFNCTLCNKRTPHSTQAKTHMKTQHNVSNIIMTPVVPHKNDLNRDEFVVRPKPMDVPPETFKEGHDESGKTGGAELKTVYLPDEIDQLPRKSIYSYDITCGQCKTFKNKVRTNIIRHLQLHQNEYSVPDTAPVNPVPCLEKNEKMFDKMFNFAISSVAHTGGRMGGTKGEAAEKEAKANEDNIPAFVPFSRRFVCCANGCNYLCPEEGNLRHHLMALHEQEVEFTCVHCRKNLVGTDIDGIMKHLKLHDLHLYKCSSCDFVHNLKHKVERHSTELHEGKIVTVRAMDSEPFDEHAHAAAVVTPVIVKVTKPWRCSMCKYRCANHSDIVAHAKNKHNIDGRYKCALCVFKTNDNAHFPEHFRLEHPEREVDIIHAYHKTEDEPKHDGAPAETEVFDTTPLWQRDRPRLRHIRGILFDDVSPVKTPKKTSPVKSHHVSQHVDKSIEAVVTGGKKTAGRKRSASTMVEGGETVVSKVEESTERAAKTKRTISLRCDEVIVIDDEDDVPDTTTDVPADEWIDVEEVEDGVDNVEDDRTAMEEVDLICKFGDLGIPANGQFKCPKCDGFKTARVRDLIQHIFSEIKYYRYKCKICEERSVTYVFMKGHCQTKHDGWSADKVDNVPQDMEVNRWIKLLIKKQTEIIKTLGFQIELNVDIDAILAQPTERSQTEQPSTEFPKTDSFECDLCEFQRPTMDELDAHYRSDHFNAKFGLQSGGATLLTPQQFVLVKKRPMDGGQLSKQPPKRMRKKSADHQGAGATTAANSECYLCSYCTHMCPTFEETQQHWLDRHADRELAYTKTKRSAFADTEESYRCGNCKVEGSIKDLEAHHAVRHADCKFNPYKYTCSICLFRFRTVRGFKNHYRGHDQQQVVFVALNGDHVVLEDRVKDKVYRCPKCTYTSRSANHANIKQHLKIHAKPYECQICNAAFKSKPEARQHFSREHPHNVEFVLEKAEVLAEQHELLSQVLASAEQISRTLDDVSTDAATTSRNHNTMRCVAMKSTGTAASKITPMDYYSFYGDQPAKVDLSKIITTFDVGGGRLPMTCQQLGKIFNLEPIVHVKDYKMVFHPVPVDSEEDYDDDDGDSSS